MKSLDATSVAPGSTATTPSTRHRILTWGAVAAAVGVGAGCAWVLYLDLHDAMGRRAFLYALLFAAIPVVPLSLVFVWLNRLRPEPRRLLLLALGWGGLVATLVSLRLNGWLAELIGDATGPRAAVFVAPWVEETSKAAIIFVVVWWRRHDFNSVGAGVVYGGLAGIGFAFTENIVYYGQIFQGVLASQGDDSLALDAVKELFWWRGVAAPFVHPMFTMMTGIGIGLAVRFRHVGVRILAPVAGFCAAALLHMGYNTVATFTAADALTAAYVGILVPTLVAAVVLVAVVRRHERHVIAARLGDYAVYGWLQADHIPYIVTWAGRRASRRYARQFGKSERAKVRAFQRTGMDLGVLRDRLVRGVAGEQELGRERDLIASIRAQRRGLLLPGGSDPGGLDATTLGSSW